MAKPKHKTCLSILRTVIGSGGGNEASFAQKIGMSRSWLTKASCGQIGLTKDTALRIAYETGISPGWLMRGDTSQPPIDRGGDLFTNSTYENHRAFMRDEFDLEDAVLSENSLYSVLQEILRIQIVSQESNKGGLFAFRLSEAVGEIKSGLGVNFKKGGCQEEDICKMAQNFAEWINKDSIPNLVGGILVPKKSKSKNSKPETPTPQKKRPSRRKFSGER
jgi:transcriptional regulator with XRE-family HTH domain